MMEPSPIHFQNSFVVFAALDPASPFPALCGITWVLLMPTSAVATLVSAVLCPFLRTLRQALRLSKLGLWSGTVACLAATLGIATTAGNDKYRHEPLSDAVITILLTSIAPTIAFFIRRFCLARLAILAAATIAPASVETADNPSSGSRRLPPAS